MYAVLKNTLLASAAAGLLTVITVSGNKNNIPVVEKTQHGLRNPFILAVDTPPAEPVTNEDLPFPIKDNQPGEPIYNPKQPLQLNSPSNIKTAVSYSPEDSSFLFTQKMGNMDYRPPITMSQEEYHDYLFKQQVKSYWKSRIQADAKSNPAKTSLIPKLTVNSELFDRLFGGNTVDIRPTGSAELIFGFITNRNQNPAIPVKQRKITNFDFNMKIQLNLVGKIGEKLKLTTNYNTEASFDFENQMKIEYNGLEDEIIKKVEAGNVSLPLNNSLITGSQTLFGVKTTLQFGKLNVVALASQQRGKKTEITVSSGTQTIPFTVTADNYEANRHYFLGQFFRDNYNSWINVPIITSPIQITKIEVYVTNRTNQVDQARNIAAFADLGEIQAHVFPDNTTVPPTTGSTGTFSLAIQDSILSLPFPRNTANNLYGNLVGTATNTLGVISDRNYNTAVHNLTEHTYFNTSTNQQTQVFNAGREFEVLTRARRLNPNTDYTLNNRLGYISLNTSLNYDEILAVSYQYTYNGRVYQVGEFSDQFPTGDKLLVLKMLKSTQLNTHIPMWDLQMKNVYSIGAYSLSQTNFQLNVIYNNLKTGVDIPYIPYGSLNGKLLVQAMNLDKINQNQDPYPDGYFDFVPNITVNTQNGRIYFTTIEPFGNDLRKAFSSTDDPATVESYVFQELYDSTRISAQQLPQKNRYKLKGSYQSATSNEYSLNSMNIPQGSVRVTAGGVPLNENVDYTVDYTLGRVKIINESILNSGQPIKISAENNSLFNIQQKSLIGTRLDYKVNKDFSLGSTLLHMTERPLTQKVNIGDEPVSNTVVGFDYNYRHDAPWLTRLVDKIPLIDTKEPSSIQMAGEFAKLIPGHSKAIGKSGNAYVDDFEGSVSVIDMRSQGAWTHASIPQGQPGLFPEASQDGLYSGFNRAKLAWYTVDQSVFYQQTSGTTPPQISKAVQSNHFMEAFFESDLFPKKTPPNGQPQLLPMLDLAYYPNERGPYNFDVTPSIPGHSSGIDVAATQSDPEGRIILKNPINRWAGITRRIETNDFQASNVEYIQFWMMDPFNEDYNTSSYHTFPNAPPTAGELYINLGSVSEDILKDGNMSYENGFADPNDPLYTSKDPPSAAGWGVYPSTPPLVNAFDNTDAARVYQDIGYDGRSNSQEQSNFSAYLSGLNGLGITGGKAFTDPAGDDYHYYRGDDYDGKSIANTLYRYKEYNGVEGNSPTQAQYQNQNGGHYSTVGSTVPNIEDANRDNTMNQSEAYYQYKIKITPQDINEANVGNNYIVNVIPVKKAGPDGVVRTVNFYQFKIPVAQFDEKIGSIEGFNSIRFMRMFVRRFSQPVIMRFARLELVRSDWRNYQQDLSDPANGIIVDASASFDVSAISLQENGTRTPINYVIPPGINQQQNVQTTNLVLLNEQALSMRVCGLKDGDRRAIYKNVNYDVRSYKKLKMFVHGEKLNNQPLNDGDVHVFIRLGSDFTNNYYEYEIPLNLSAPGNYANESDGDRSKVWLPSNDMEIVFADLTSTKLLRNEDKSWPITKPYPRSIGDGRIVRVCGNPNIASLTNIMVGIYNPISAGDPSDKCAEVWINELRLTDFDQHGGEAANSRVTAKLADFGQVSLSGAFQTPFYGSIEKKPSERSRDRTLQYDVSTTLQMGKFFPKDWKLNVPMYLGYSEIIVTPQYDPNNPDILMSSVNGDNGFSDEQIKGIKSRAQDYTRRRGLNFTNVSKQKGKNKTKSYPWDIENFSATYAFTELYKHNLTTKYSFNKQYNGGLNYNYQQTVKPIEPFKDSKASFLQSPWLAIVKDINFTPMPSQFNFGTNITRTYIETLSRDITSLTDYYVKPQFNKTFNISRIYAMRWDLTKNVKLDFNANNDGRILEPHAEYAKGDKEKVEQRLLSGGLTTAYKHQTNINVTVPLNKIPILDFISSTTYKYSSSYQWQRRPFAQDSIGNTINNNQQHTVNMSWNMNTLYNKVPYFKRVILGLNNKKDETPKPKDTKPKDPKDPKKKDDKDTTKPKDPPAIFEHVARLIMTLKQVSFTFNQTQGTTLPGFRDSTYLLGMNERNNTFAPGPGFVFGQQGHIVSDAEKSSWLVKRQNFSNPYAHTFMRTYSYQAKIEPFKNFKIDLTGSRTYGLNDGFFIGYDANKTTDNGYTHITPTQTGNFSISVLTLKTAFKGGPDKTKGYNSTIFDEFMQQRGNYSILLSGISAKKGYSAGNGDGYNANQQDVVILAFMDAYTKKKSKTLDNKSLFPQIPMPNWNVTYDGIGKLKFLQPVFKSVVVSHAYRSTMSIGGFTNNQAFGINDDYFGGVRTDLSNSQSNFVSKYVINSVTLSEQFAPLIKFNMNFVDKGKLKGLGANVELKKDRTTTLSANIPQVMEMRGNEINVGSTYTFPNLSFQRLKIQGKPLKSDLQMNVTFSVRQNQTVIHKINVDPTTNSEYQFSQLTNGTNIISIKTSFTYVLSQNINLRFFYDRTINKPVISTSFPTQTTNAGVSLRFVIQ
ncbi:MAG: T9SS outer membrane translocon Sov/SprA [Bacteroidia bacterium]